MIKYYIIMSCLLFIIILFFHVWSFFLLLLLTTITYLDLEGKMLLNAVSIKKEVNSGMSLSMSNNRYCKK